MTIYRLEADNGLLLKRGIKVNDDYLIVEECTLNQKQEISQKWLIQGGPYPGPAVFQKKIIEGTISVPLFVDEDYTIHPAIVTLLTNAERPFSSIKIDTNYAYSHFNPTVDDPGTDNNELVSFDTCLVKKASISCDVDSNVKLTFDIVGLIETRDPVDFTAVTDDYGIWNAVSWPECDASRFQSEMRSVSSLNFTINNDIQTPVFLVPSGSTTRSDQPTVMYANTCEWTGNYEETVVKGLEKETYIHGGWMVNENLVLTFGPLKTTLPVPLFKIGEQPLSGKFRKRKIDFLAQMQPSHRRIGNMITYVE